MCTSKPEAVRPTWQEGTLSDDKHKNVQKTKEIANHRILIEQVIRRLKTFRILAIELPISLIGHVDEMISVCAALSNLKEPIYKV